YAQPGLALFACRSEEVFKLLNPIAARLISSTSERRIMFGDRKWALPVIAIPILADLIAALAHASAFWSEFIPGLYYAAIVFVGLRLGWKAGLGFTVLSGISHAVIGNFLSASPMIRLRASGLAFLIVGFALIEERRRSTSAMIASKEPPAAA